jgi:hypothetical protein
VDDLVAGRPAGDLDSALLAEGASFDQEDIRRLRARLRALAPRDRHAVLKLLSLRYLGGDDLAAEARRLCEDPDGEIRRRAFAILRSLGEAADDPGA